MSRAVLWLPIGLYIAACCLPALEWQNVRGGAPDVMFGLRALAVGWAGIFAAVFGWFANPFWAFGLLLGMLNKRNAAAVFGVIGFLISLTLFIDIWRELPANEGNVGRQVISRILPGGYVWLLSLATLPAVVLLRKPR